jgi:hypothetical protein
MNKCKVCTSKHRGEIETQIKNGLSSRVVSHFVKVSYNEDISHTAIANHVKFHLIQNETEPLTPLTPTITTPTEDVEDLIASLEARIRNLEIEAQRHTGYDDAASWIEFEGGRQNPMFFRANDVFLEGVPNANALEDERRHIVGRMVREKKAERGKQTDPRVAAAERQEILENDRLRNMTPERRAEADDNDKRAAEWFAKKEAEQQAGRDAAKASAARQEAQRKAAKPGLKKEGEVKTG